jgi:hypothetical protein
MNRTIATLATVVALLAATSTPFSTAEARNPNSTKKTHYLSPPIPLLPYIEQLRICVADAEMATTGKQTYFQYKLTNVRVISFNGGTLMETEPKLLAPGELGVCFDIDTNELGPAGGAPPEAILAELIVSAPPESQAVPIVTFELRDPESDTTRALLLPAVQAEAPIVPGRFSNYRPQFYSRTPDVGTLTHIFGPFTLTGKQEVEICAADAAKIPTDSFSLNFEEIKWTIQGWDIETKQLILEKDIETEERGVCFDGIGIADLGLGEPGGAELETLGLLILLYASAPPGSQAVPMATGRLKLLIFDEPIPVSLLLPAVQAAREAEPK